jgi:hypothetical protein
MPDWKNEDQVKVRLSEQQRMALIRKARNLHVTPSAVLRFALNKLLAESPKEAKR